MKATQIQHPLPPETLVMVPNDPEYRDDIGTIEIVDRIFKQVNGSLDIFGHTIKHITLPHTFDGRTLTITYPEEKLGFIRNPEHTEIYKFRCYAYSVRFSNGDFVVFADSQVVSI